MKYTKTNGPKSGKRGHGGLNLGPYASQPALNKQAPNPNNGGKAGHTGKSYNRK